MAKHERKASAKARRTIGRKMLEQTEKLARAMANESRMLEAGELLDVIRKALALVPSAKVRAGSLEALEELERRIVMAGLRRRAGRRCRRRSASSRATAAEPHQGQDRAVVWCVRWCTFALAAKPSKVKRFGARLTWHLERCRSRLRWAGVGEGAIQA